MYGENQIKDNLSPIEKMPRHLEFINAIYKELITFNAEEQSEILRSLYRQIEDKYLCEIDEVANKLESLKKQHSIINQSKPQ